MPSPDAHSERPHSGPETPDAVDLDRGIIGGWRRRNAERRHARLLRPRNRRALAERLRRTAADATGRYPAGPGLDASVHDRAAAVRPKLLEIADLLEHAYDPDPASVEEVGQLLANRYSPLYHPAIHISELYAALYYVRAGLITQATGRRPADLPRRAQTEPRTNGNLPREGDHHHTAADAEERDRTTPKMCAESASLPADWRTTAAKRQLAVLQRLRERHAERKHARLVSSRNRRILARWLRRTATHATDRDPIRRRHDVLLHYRAAAVRTDLLEIAALVEHAHHPDPDCVAALRDLLADGCDSPLYNADIHFSELHAVLAYVRSGL